MTALLHQLGGGRQIPVDRAVVLVGRGADCDAVLDCSSKISRIHCAIVQVDRDYYLRDLGSMNGVWVAGQKITREQRLQDGVEICIGDVRFLFLENVALAPAVPFTANPAGSVTATSPAVDGSVRASAELEKTIDENPRPALPPAAMPRIAIAEEDRTVLATAPAVEHQLLQEPVEMEVDVEVIEDP